MSLDAVTPQVRARLAEAALQLVRIPSPTGKEAELAGFFERWALAQPQLSRDDVIRHNNALIIGQPDSRRPCLALVGHLDTVAGHSGDPPPHQRGDQIIGLGASDMKGALAVMQVLVETLTLDYLPFALVLVLYDREEGPYNENGLGPLLENFEILNGVDLAVAMEPTDNTLQLGCMGGIHARITYRGKAAHSARPWQGENAVHKAGPLLSALLEQKPRDVEVSGLVFREAMSVTVAKGGVGRNVIPDKFELNLNYRFAPVSPINETIDRALAEVMKMAPGGETEIVDVAPPGPVPVDNPILEHLQSHTDLEVQPKQAWTDVARLSAHGIDAVNFGPGAGAQAHQRGEWVSHAALVQAYEILARVLTAPLEGMP
jgi:succinyl-diaminopimelate desuccinylase